MLPSVVFLGIRWLASARNRRPVESLTVDRDLIFLRQDKLFEANLFSQGLLVRPEATFSCEEVLHSVGIDLPLFHLFVTGDRLCILGVQVVVWNKYWVGVGLYRLQSKFGKHENAELKALQSGIVRRHCLVVEPKPARLHSHVRLEPTSSEATKVFAISD